MNRKREKVKKTKSKNGNHSPTLSTILMVEQELGKTKEPIKISELKRRLPKKVMHSTLLSILDYLQMSEKIMISTKGIVWIYEPKQEINGLIKEVKNDK